MTTLDRIGEIGKVQAEVERTVDVASGFLVTALQVADASQKQWCVERALHMLNRDLLVEFDYEPGVRP